MSINNGKIAVRIEDVKHCIADLARRGCEIKKIKLGANHDNPRITIARPPGRARLEGHERKVQNLSGRRVKTFTANKHGCQIEWRELA